MKAAVYYEQGGAEVFRIEDIATPACHPKGLLMRVEAVSLEGGDLLDRSGNLGPLRSTPYVAGRQAAGEIVEVGAEVDGFHVGQKVVASRPNGSYAEFFAVPAKQAWVIPADLDVVTAAAIPIAFGTAEDALLHSAQLQPGESVLVQAGTGGVGLAAIQIARHRGAGAILTTGSSDERLAKLTAFGANHLINHRRSAVVQEVMRLTDGHGVDVVIDTVGGATLQCSVAALAEGGRVVMVGQAAREPAMVDIANLIPTSGRILGFKLEIGGPRLRLTIAGLLDACSRGDYRVVIDRTFPMSEVAAAHRHVESRAAFGRVILLPVWN